MNDIQKLRHYYEKQRDAAQDEANQMDNQIRDLQNKCPHANRIGYNVRRVNSNGSEYYTNILYLKCADCGEELHIGTTKFLHSE